MKTDRFATGANHCLTMDTQLRLTAKLGCPAQVCLTKVLPTQVWEASKITVSKVPGAQPDEQAECLLYTGLLQGNVLQHHMPEDQGVLYSARFSTAS